MGPLGSQYFHFVERQRPREVKCLSESMEGKPNVEWNSEVVLTGGTLVDGRLWVNPAVAHNF